MRVAVVTIITKSHLAYARVLMDSVRRWAPEARRFAILADRIDGAFDPSQEDFEIVLCEALSIPQTSWFYFKYTAMEVNMALKPHAIQFLFERFGFDAVIYFDADIRIYAGLEPLLGRLNAYSLMLTPHLDHPLGDGQRPSDWDILRAGVYNGGFVAVRNCDESQRFLNWWKTRLQDHCLVDYPNGLFVDQRWLDFVPGFFPEAGILRDPGYNLAYWNLGERQVERSGDQWLVNGKPLYFVHFSGFDPERPDSVSRYQNRHSLSTLGEAERTLFLDYAKDVMNRGHRECKILPYAYGFFDNGTPIHEKARNAFYDSAELVRTIDDPFSEAGYQALIRFWNEPPGTGARTVTDQGYSGRGNESREQQASATGSLPRIAWSIYESRADLQKAFPDPSATDRLKFLRWLLSSGAAELGLGREFLEPLQREWDSALSRLNPFDRLRERSLRWAMAARARAR